MPTELVMEGAGKQRWIEANNLPSMVKLLRTLLDSERAPTLEVDWLWLEIGSISANDLHLARCLIVAAKSNGCRAAILFWRADSCLPNDVLDDWQDWSNSLFSDWVATLRSVSNIMCGGPIWYKASFLFLLPVGVAEVLNDFSAPEVAETMESYLDDSNSRNSDYIGGWSLCSTQEPDNVGCDASSYAAVDCTINWKGKEWAVFWRDAVAPDVTQGNKEYCFLLTTGDAGLRRAIRPIRDSELFRMYGFPEEFAVEAVKLPE